MVRIGGLAASFLAMGRLGAFSQRDKGERSDFEPIHGLVSKNAKHGLYNVECRTYNVV